MADADIQGMLVRIEATTAGLRRELDLGDSRVKKFADNTNRASGKVDGAFSGMAGAAARLLAPLASAVSAFEALGKAVEVQRQFDVLNAGLITATGSSAKAAVAFEALQRFAAQTPYSLDQAVEGFTKLVNLGLTPSEAALHSYGNTAAAMGKDLNQMIEAVADAATGEFERLKEFGITSSQQGDKVSLTFRGVTTTIGKNAKAIEGYLLNLGNTDFAGAMDQRAKTLDGAISNLGDTWDATFRLINERGLGKLMEEAVGVAADALQDLNDSIASGQFEAYLEAVGGKFSGVADDIAQTLTILDGLFAEFFTGLGSDMGVATSAMIEAFKDFPENVRAFIQLMTVEVLAGFDKAQAYAVAFKDSVKAVFTDDTIGGVGERLAQSLNGINLARTGSIEQILAERDTAVESYKKQSAAADERLRKYREERATALAAGKDVLAQFGKQATASTANTAASKELEAQRKREAKALTDLKAQTDIAIASAQGLAAAYLAGTDRSREFGIQQKVEEALLKAGAGARAGVEKAIRGQADAEDRLAVSKAAYDLQQETTDLVAQAKATLQGAEALETYNVQKAMQVALAGKNIEFGSQEYEQLLDATKAQQEAVKVMKQASDAGSIVDRLYPQSKLLRDYTEEQAALNRAIDLYPEKADAYRDALQRLGVEYQQNKNAATSWGQFTEGAIDRIDDAFADMWKSVLSKSGNFMDTLKDSFRQFLAEMLHMAITKPILVQFASALGVGGASAQSSGLFGDLAGSGGGIMSYLNTAKNVMSAAGSSFGKSLISGWTSGDGIVGGIQGAFTNGADYLGSAITGAFATGSATASNAAASLAAGASQAGYTGAAYQGYVSSANAAASLSSLTTALSYVGAVYSVIQSYQAYGAKGAATTAGFAAAGAAIGSVVPIIGTALGAAIGAVVGSFVSSKAFGSGEKYPDLSTSATGRYVGGQYIDTGVAQSWQTKAPKYGSAADGAMSTTLAKFSSTLGNLYQALGNGAPVVAYSTLQQRKTSGKYSSTFGAQLDDGSVITGKQQFKADDIAAALTADYDDIMGTFLAKAIVSSKSLPEYFKSQFTAFSNDWNTTADQVIKAIEGVFTRFNGVNDALSLINVANLKLDNTGLIASDSILNMIGAISDLDTATATAKEKVDALNKSVGTYYQAFFSADEQFADLTQSLQGAFSGFGLKLPDTRSAYRKMVEDIDVTTTAGQAMFATMMGLATNADTYYTQIDKQAQAAVDAANEAAQAAASAWSNYYGLFATDTQKAGDALMGASAEFAALGLGLPASRSDFAAMVNAIDQTTAAGKSLFNSLLGLATDADAAFDVMEASAAIATQAAQEAAKAQADAAQAAKEAAESAAQAIKDALDLAVSNSFDAVQRAITAQQAAAEAAYNATSASINDMLATANSLVSDLAGVSNDLGSALKSLRGDSDEATKVLRRQAQATLQSALVTARAGGSLANFAGLSDALTTVSSNSADLYSSLEDFNRDQGRTANVVAQLNQLNGKQLTNAEKSAKALQDQLDQAKKAYDAQVAQFDSQLAFAQSQLDALNGVDTTVQSVKDAVDRMNSAVVAALAAQAVGAATGNTYDNNAALLESVYQRVLGRSVEAGGLSFWSSLLANGSVTYGTLVDEIAKGGKAHGETVKVPGYAAGGNFGGGLRLVGENGPELEVTGPSRIFDARTTAAMLNGGGSDAAVVVELRAVRAELELIKANTQSSALSTSKTGRLLDRVTDGGNAMLTKELA